MRNGFRQSMAWLHAWSGLVVGWVLFAVFVTGMASYYRTEISQWMRPELRSSAALGRTGWRRRRTRRRPPAGRTRRARGWFITPAAPREPAGGGVLAQRPGRPPDHALLDPETGAPAAVRETRGGDFLYRFHFELNMPPLWGRWIVGICAMIMLVALVSGIITHRRIFADFFTFRRDKSAQRGWLDAHNVTGVLALPFHLMITYTGLVTLALMYMPWGVNTAYRGRLAALLRGIRPDHRAAPARGPARHAGPGRPDGAAGDGDDPGAAGAPLDHQPEGRERVGRGGVRGAARPLPRASPDRLRRHDRRGPGGPGGRAEAGGQDLHHDGRPARGAFRRAHLADPVLPVRPCRLRHGGDRAPALVGGAPAEARRAAFLRPAARPGPQRRDRGRPAGGRRGLFPGEPASARRAAGPGRLGGPRLLRRLAAHRPDRPAAPAAPRLARDAGGRGRPYAAVCAADVLRIVRERLAGSAAVEPVFLVFDATMLVLAALLLVTARKAARYDGARRRQPARTQRETAPERNRPAVLEAGE